MVLIPTEGLWHFQLIGERAVVEHKITESVEQRLTQGQHVGEVVIGDGFGTAVRMVRVLDASHTSREIFYAGYFLEKFACIPLHLIGAS